MPFILRVDDCGWTPEHKPDVGLEYFRRWRDALSLQDQPHYLGFIPTCLGDGECRWLRDNLTPQEHIALHGWDHRPGVVVTADDMRRGLAVLEATGRLVSAYIPPFNDYDLQTMAFWRQAGGTHFFGGFHGHDHDLGTRPRIVDRMTHLPAERLLYDRAGPLCERLAETAAPAVVTLHCTWDAQNLATLAGLRRLLKDNLVPAARADAWLAKTALSRRQLTAAHYLAQSWVLENLPPSRSYRPLSHVLDFGARNSSFPSLMQLLGHQAVAFDRDPVVVKLRSQIIDLAYTPQCVCGDWRDAIPAVPEFDAITAIWSVQHNEPEEQWAILQRLLAALKPGGRLLMVNKLAHGQPMVHEAGRADPLWKFDFGTTGRQVEAIGFRVARWDTFWYRHNTEQGDWCRPEQADAICWNLEKPL